MKCLNCRRYLLTNARCCPSCGTLTPLGRAPASSLETRAAVDPNAWSEYSRELTVRALVLMLIGLVFVIGAAWYFYDAQSLPVQACQVTADDLLRAKSPQALPDWISYSPSKCIDTSVEYVKLTLLGRTTTSKFLLLPIKDRWLLARTAPEYNSRHFEGKLVEIDSEALSKIAPNFPVQTARLLPYQFDTRTEIVGYQRGNYILCGFGAILGTLAFFSGIRSLMARPPSFRGPVSPPTTIAVPGSRHLSSLQFLTDRAPAPASAVPAPHPASQPDAAPRRRSWLLRALLTLVWAAVLFIAAVVITSVVCTLRAGNDPELGKKLAQQAGQSLGPLLLLGSIGLATTLGYLGWLPGTRR